MFGAIAKAIFGSSNDRYVKSMRPLVAKINALEPQFEAMGDEELQNQTQLLKARLAEGETLDDILPEAFATVRDAAQRVLGQRHYDVQLVGGVVMHRGAVAEMPTGEGTKRVSALTPYLTSLSRRGVQFIQVNQETRT